MSIQRFNTAESFSPTDFDVMPLVSAKSACLLPAKLAVRAKVASSALPQGNLVLRLRMLRL
jgi:hypothetical protein